MCFLKVISGKISQLWDIMLTTRENSESRHRIRIERDLQNGMCHREDVLGLGQNTENSACAAFWKSQGDRAGAAFSFGGWVLRGAISFRAAEG